MVLFLRSPFACVNIFFVHDIIFFTSHWFFFIYTHINWYFYEENIRYKICVYSCLLSESRGIFKDLLNIWMTNIIFYIQATFLWINLSYILRRRYNILVRYSDIEHFQTYTSSMKYLLYSMESNYCKFEWSIKQII